MRILEKVALAGSLLLASCEAQQRPIFDYVDLNGDGIREIVERKYTNPGVALTAKFSRKLNHDVSYSKPRVIVDFGDVEPKEYSFVDFDGDGDVDLIFSRYVEIISGRSRAFLSRNNGKGIFSEPVNLN